ncbi:prepilin-type N-terminal cleavage/methylation domain-containing protein [Sporosarcina sp. Marseille-Q4063]|uniref:prepilin-type N-terminal cleavage/methylation domain-containing protein n=1 Tax=Sporosarcina sp. Marseille-Q4063 TaxID=2810514 RepID=UPI001BB086EE|nr:prepilin-type N-terminal cleavage/methylation domain-containing protein [Sporosarcina sp. Marseille-Q4063]QUW22502.1 prepilin-type N-terminal cleavage/methylation domain-containing protein [Sporosarcina sp. Marseille-Q4063]
MFKNMKKQLNNEKGLTLIELLAVIVILAIIAVIAVPAIGKVIANTKDKAVLAEASNILSGAKIAVVDGACKDTEATVGTEKVITTTCNQAALKGFVQGIPEKDGTVDITYSAERVGNDWSVSYSRFANISNSKYNSGIVLGKTDEANLNKLLNNEGTVPAN